MVRALLLAAHLSSVFGSHDIAPHTETYRDGRDAGWCTYATCNEALPANIRWGHGNGHLVRVCVPLEPPYDVMPSSSIVHMLTASAPAIARRT